MSCMVRAGWSFLKFSASKLSQADSTSGPSATSQPIADEHVGDALGELRDRVPGAARAAVPRQRDVDGLLDEHPLVALGTRARRAGRRTPPAPRWRAAFTRLPASARAGPGSDPSSRRASSSGGAVAEVRGLGGGQRGEVGRGRERLAGRGDGGVERVGVQKVMTSVSLIGP